jgi:putative ABC transport system ATP-binding protein
VGGVTQTISSTSVAARAEAATKVYGTGDTAVYALNGITVQFERSAFTAIMGPSGSGKSTLLHCLAGLDKLTSGHVFLGDLDMSSMNDKELTKVRRDRIGFIFQSFNLVPTLNAYENITLPMALGGHKTDDEWVNTIIDTVNLRDRLTHRPAELSGGQQQRVAVARALASRPEVIFADEPTGNLDTKASGAILKFMKQAVSDFGQTIVMVTHDPFAASHANRVVYLADGQIVDEIIDPTTDSVLDRMRKFGE